MKRLSDADIMQERCSNNPTKASMAAEIFAFRASKLTPDEVTKLAEGKAIYEAYDGSKLDKVDQYIERLEKERDNWKKRSNILWVAFFEMSQLADSEGYDSFNATIDGTNKSLEALAESEAPHADK